MKLLLDQNMRARLGAYLRSLGHDATRVGKDYPAGLADMRILTLARSEGRILLTQDKDFVVLVVRRQLSHAGVVFFQLGNAALPIWIDRLETVLRDHADDLA
ncbi:MAG: DUF5615 family PIN-like protein, partial [Chloroflexota bacterium]